jgi:hypothetical protein
MLIMQICLNTWFAIMGSYVDFAAHFPVQDYWYLVVCLSGEPWQTARFPPSGSQRLQRPDCKLIFTQLENAAIKRFYLLFLSFSEFTTGITNIHSRNTLNASVCILSAGNTFEKETLMFLSYSVLPNDQWSIGFGANPLSSDWLKLKTFLRQSVLHIILSYIHPITLRTAITMPAASFQTHSQLNAVLRVMFNL